LIDDKIGGSSSAFPHAIPRFSGRVPIQFADGLLHEEAVEEAGGRFQEGDVVLGQQASFHYDGL
jgi:hypothetical protein